MKYLSRISKFNQALCLSFLLLAATNVPLFAQAGLLAAWTNVGSVGTVDEADTAKVGFVSSQAYLKAGFNSAVIRYNVTATDGLFVGPNMKLTARFLKPNQDTRVVVRVFRHELATGAVVLLATLDSNAFAPAAAFQAQRVPFLPVAAPDFNFARASYFIEVTLIRTAAAGDPRLSMLQITTS